MVDYICVIISIHRNWDKRECPYSPDASLASAKNCLASLKIFVKAAFVKHAVK